MAKVIVVNGSPNKDKGTTALVLRPFVQGMIESGAEVETLYVEDIKPERCSCGRMHCWYREPGVCCFKDAMQEVYPKLAAAETLVLATPMYSPLPGRMQDFLNRIVPLIEPQLEIKEGRTRARWRDGVAIRRVALVAVGGWWELANLDALVYVARELAANTGVEFAGALLRPHGDWITDRGGLTGQEQDIAAALQQAGVELAGSGRISETTAAAVRRPLIGHEKLVRSYNRLLHR